MLINTVQAIAHEAGVRCDISDQSSFVLADVLEGFRIDLQNNAKSHVSGKAKFVNSCLMQATGEGCKIYIDDNVHLDRVRLIIQGRDSVIYIGKNTHLKNCTVKIDGQSCAAIVGSRTSWESGTILCSRIKTNVIVGDDCMLSNDIVIRTDDGHDIFDRTTRKLINAPESVIIEPHVWIGNGARVNRGVRLGTGSILGTASVLASDMDPNCVYAGVPARKIKENIVWSRSEDFNAIPEEYR